MNADQVNADQELYERVHLGAEARDFVTNHPIGKVMREKADRDWSEAVMELESADPEDAKAIRTAQNKALRAKEFLFFIEEAIHEGETAIQQLEEERDPLVD